MSLWERLRRRPLSLSPGTGPAAPHRDRAPGLAPDPAGASGPGGPGDPGAGEGDLARALRAADQLISEGSEGRALELLGRLAAARPDEAQVLLRLSELLCARRDHRRALPVLARLLAVAEGGLRIAAHDLLSQAHEALGEPAEAARHLEALLCEDLDHPRARARYDRLRGDRASPRATDRTAQELSPQALATLAGAGAVQHQRYRLLRELGRGSAGTVYLALDEELGRELAVKVFHPRSSGPLQHPQDPRAQRAAAAAQAWNEARLMASVRHRGVVAVYELDEERGLLVMELCRGGTLRQRLGASPLPVGIALARARELFEVLAVVHRAGVVHGDLKPANLLFRGGDEIEEHYGDLVLADFGVARLGGEGGPQAGTLGYLAPERRGAGARLEPAADLYAAGAILLEMLRGALPLSRAQLLRGDPLAPSLGPAAAALGSAAPALEALLGGLLSADPARRPDAQAALRALPT